MRHPSRSRRDFGGERGGGGGNFRGAINFQLKFVLLCCGIGVYGSLRSRGFSCHVVILVQNGCFTRTFRTEFQSTVTSHRVADLQRQLIHSGCLSPFGLLMTPSVRINLKRHYQQGLFLRLRTGFLRANQPTNADGVIHCQSQVCRHFGMHHSAGFGESHRCRNGQSSRTSGRSQSRRY